MGLVEQLKDIKANITTAKKLIASQDNNPIKASDPTDKIIESLEDILKKLKSDLTLIESIIKKETIDKRKQNHEEIKKSLLLNIALVLLCLVEKLDDSNFTSENNKLDRYRNELKSCHVENLAFSEQEKERIKKASLTLNQKMESLFNNNNLSNKQDNEFTFGNVKLLTKNLNSCEAEFYDNITKGINYFSTHSHRMKERTDANLTLAVMQQTNAFFQAAIERLPALSQKEKEDKDLQEKACQVLYKQIKHGFKAVMHYSIIDQPKLQADLIAAINTARKLGMEFAAGSNTYQAKFEKAKTIINTIIRPFYNQNLDDRQKLRKSLGKVDFSGIKRNTSFFQKVDQLLTDVERAISAFSDIQIKHARQLVNDKNIAFLYVTEEVWNEIKSCITNFNHFKKTLDEVLKEQNMFFSSYQHEFNNSALKEYMTQKVTKARYRVVNNLILSNEFIATVNRHVADSYIKTKGAQQKNAKPYYALSKQYIDAAMAIMRDEKHTLPQKEIESISAQEKKIHGFYHLHFPKADDKKPKSQLEMLIEAARNCKDLNKAKSAYQKAIIQAKKENNKSVQIELQEDLVKTILFIEKQENTTPEVNHKKYYSTKIDWANSLLDILTDAVQTRKTLPKNFAELRDHSGNLCRHLKELSQFFFEASLVEALSNHLKFREQLLILSLKIANQLIDFAMYIEDTESHQSYLQQVKQELERMKQEQRIATEEIARKKAEEQARKEQDEIYQKNFQTLLKLFPCKRKKPEKKSKEDIDTEYFKCFKEFRADKLITEEWLTPQYIDTFGDVNHYTPIKEISIDERKRVLKEALDSGNAILIIKAYIDLAEDQRRLGFSLSAQYAFDDAAAELEHAEQNLSQAKQYLVDAKSLVSSENDELNLEVFEDWLAWMLNDSLLKINLMYLLQKNLTEKSDRDHDAAKARIVLREGTKAWNEYEEDNAELLAKLSSRKYEEVKEEFIQQTGLKAWKKFGPNNPFSEEKLSLPAKMRRKQHARFNRIKDIREQIINISPDLIDESLKEIPTNRDEVNASNVNESTPLESKETCEELSLNIHSSSALFFSRSREWQKKATLSRVYKYEDDRRQANDEELSNRIDDALRYNPPILKRSESFESFSGIKAEEMRFFHKLDNNTLSIDQRIEIENKRKNGPCSEMKHIFRQLKTGLK